MTPLARQADVRGPTTQREDQTLSLATKDFSSVTFRPVLPVSQLNWNTLEYFLNVVISRAICFLESRKWSRAAALVLWPRKLCNNYKVGERVKSFTSSHCHCVSVVSATRTINDCRWLCVAITIKKCANRTLKHAQIIHAKDFWKYFQQVQQTT